LGRRETPKNSNVLQLISFLATKRFTKITTKMIHENKISFGFIFLAMQNIITGV